MAKRDMAFASSRECPATYGRMALDGGDFRKRRLSLPYGQCGSAIPAPRSALGLEAVAAVDRAGAGWPERHPGVAAALCADRVEHLALRTLAQVRCRARIPARVAGIRRG